MYRFGIFGLPVYCVTCALSRPTLLSLQVLSRHFVQIWY